MSKQQPYLYLKEYDPKDPIFQHYTRKNCVNYHGQKSMAKKRKVPFNFTFKEWITWWVNTGHFHERGVRGQDYQMCRYNDTGAYEPNNVYCDTGANNRNDCNKQGWTRRGVFATNIKTKETIFFTSISKAAMALFNNLTAVSSISQCCQGNQKKSKGYTFKYKV